MPYSAKEEISRLPQSRLSAEALLTGLLNLVIHADDVEQLTAGLVEATFGVHLEPYEEDSSAYAARLTEMWNFKVEVSDDEFYGHGVDLHFFDNEGGTRAAMSDICAVDAEAFSDTLAAAGFGRQPYPGIHGGFGGDFLTRGRIRVTTSVRGEASEPPERRTHNCITAVQVQRYE